jgi:putative FmdB family regulatory protein
MPILKYRCGDCGKEFAKIIVNEQYVPFECPVCGSKELAENGAAFNVDPAQMERALCMSCDSCEDESSCGL